MVYTHEDCRKALRKAANELGKSPTKSEYESLDIIPSATTILRVIGGWNEAKELADLETYTQGDNWNNPIHPQPEWVDLPEGYEWEDLTPQQRWYYQNRDHRISVKIRRERDLRLWFYELKCEFYECSKCGEDHPGCLDFHHIGSKKKDVSIMVNHGYSKESILTELEKCVPLCANCHNKEHMAFPGWWNRVDPPVHPPSGTEHDRNLRPYPEWSDMNSKEEHRGNIRSWLYEYKWHSEGCSRCGETHPICLEFHHTNDEAKSASINELVLKRETHDRMMAEIEKCELICRNCHRKEHYEPPVSNPDPSDIASQH